MNRYFRARGAILIVCALTLVAALLFSLSPVFVSERAAVRADAVPAPSAFEAGEADAVSRFLNDREQTRALETLQINSIIADESADASIRAAAQRELLALTKRMEQETVIEGILRMRGHRDAVATVNGECVNILVRGDAVSQSEAAFIIDIVMRETGKLAGDVKIIPIE